MSSVKVTHEIIKPFSPILYLSRLIGLQPVKWKKSDSGWTITKSKKYLVYSVIFNFFIGEFRITMSSCQQRSLVCFGIYGLYKVYQIESIYTLKHHEGPRRYVKFIELGVVFSTFILGGATMTWKVDKCVNYFHHLNKVRLHPTHTIM